MGKGKKFIVLLGSLFVMVPLFSVLISYQSSVELPFFFIPLDEYPIVGHVLPMVVFYLASLLLVVDLVFFLIILFYPKKITRFIFRESLGTLVITKKAVEGIVKEMLEKKQLMIEPVVTAKMRKRKIQIVVRGNLAPSKELFSKTDQYAKEVEKYLHQLIGSDVKIHIRLNFVAFKNKAKSRVS